jgi:DNA-binding transcriptional ArsR family regulator
MSLRAEDSRLSDWLAEDANATPNSNREDVYGLIENMATALRIERALDALGDPTRRAVFRRLRRGNRSVREIADGMEVSRPAVSQHLKVLKAAGLIMVRVDGARRLYGVDPNGIETLRNWLDGFWDETLVAFKQAAEQEQHQSRS